MVIASALASVSAARAGGDLFVLDIDDLIVSTVPARENANMRRFYRGERFRIGEVSYRVAPGAVEFIQYLLNAHGGEIAFFSSAPRSRNIQILNRIRMPPPDGRNLMEVCQGRVRSLDSITASNAEGRGFIQRMMMRAEPNLYDLDNRPEVRIDPTLETPSAELDRPFYNQSGVKKDVRLFDHPMNRVVLIEDQSMFAARGQERNLLVLPSYARSRAYDINNWLEGGASGVDGDSPVPSNGMRDDFSRHFQAENRFAYAAGILDEAMQRRNRSGVSLPDALWDLQPALRDPHYESGMPHQQFGRVEHYRRGARAMRQVNSSYRTNSIFSELPCPRFLRQALSKLRVHRVSDP